MTSPPLNTVVQDCPHHTDQETEAQEAARGHTGIGYAARIDTRPLALGLVLLRKRNGCQPS